MQEIYQPSKHSSSNLEPVVQLDRRENDTFLKKNPKRNGRLYTLPNHIFPIQSAFPRLFSRGDRTKNHSSPRTPRRGGKERRKKNRDAGGKGIVGEERPRNITQSADSGCSRPSIIAADIS